jgi:hypothetical protein
VLTSAEDQTDVIQALLAHGADSEMADQDGGTPLDLAQALVCGSGDSAEKHIARR